MNDKTEKPKKRFNFIRGFPNRLRRLANLQLNPSGLSKSLNNRLGDKPIRPKIVVTKRERKFFAWLGGLTPTVIVAAIAVMAVASIIASIIYGGPSHPQSTQLPPVQITPSDHPIVDIWGGYEKLSQSEARNLQTQENVLNLAILSGGSASYLKGYGVSFNPDNPGSWQEMDQPPGFTNLSIVGTGIQVGADNQTYNLNMYQAFVRAKDPANLYLVDKDGHIWTTLYSKDVVVSLDQVKSPIQIAPNPELSFTF
jgi:hypothetical protein